MAELSPVAVLLRRADPDRFLTALFAPAERREALFTLYAFNHELARAREAASEPMLSLIRLQWWREVVEGEARRHEVATPLTALIEAGLARREDLLKLIEAREAEVEEGIEDWRAWLFAGAGGLAVAAGRLLEAPEPEVLRPLGAAYGAAGLRRSEALRLRQGRTPMPEGLAAEANDWLATAPKLPRHAIAAALPAVLARRDLARPPHAHPRGLADRIAVLRAYLAAQGAKN